MIIAYWDKTDLSPIEAFVTQWRAHFPEFRVLGDVDIEPLLRKHASDEHLEMYRDIRIPAAKSDIARLLALYEHGGLYVDCHVGVIDPEGVRQMLNGLKTFEMIVWDLNRKKAPRPSTKIIPINTWLCARSGSEIIREIMQQTFSRLVRHRRHERTHGFFPYHIPVLSGAVVIEDTIMNSVSDEITRLRAGYEGRIGCGSEDACPIRRNVHHSYKTASEHWYLRQQREPLFGRAAPSLIVRPSVANGEPA